MIEFRKLVGSHPEVSASSVARLRRGQALDERLKLAERCVLAVAACRPTNHVTITSQLERVEYMRAFASLKQRLRRDRGRPLIYFGTVARGRREAGYDGHFLLWTSLHYGTLRKHLRELHVQAKRWQNPVGRPEIQKFFGALHGKRASKGVLITTSSFTADAIAYADSVTPRVILVDGKELARLMVEYGVGVTPVRRYDMKRIDLDYFAADDETALGQPRTVCGCGRRTNLAPLELSRERLGKRTTDALSSRAPSKEATPLR